MATIVKEPLLNGNRCRRWRRKKFIAILVFAFFLIALVSYLASGKSSRKLHKNIHRLEDRFEDMEKSFKREIEALKLERKSLSQASTKQNGNVTSFNTEKTLTNLQKQLRETQEEMKAQKEAMRSLFKMFESYKEETSKELSELKSMHINDQHEIQRLQNTIKQHETQKISENKSVNQKKESNEDKVQVTSPPVPETKPKSNSNILARSAKAVKEYVSNLAYKLNPFRSSRDKPSNSKPASQESKIPIALQGTIKKSLGSEPIQAEKNFVLLTKDIGETLESLISMLNNAASLDDPAEMLKKIDSKFHHLERVIAADYISTKLSGKDQERVLKWRKNYIPVKEQFEKIMHDNRTHGSKSYKHSSKNLQKLANTTRHFKDTLHNLCEMCTLSILNQYLLPLDVILSYIMISE